MILKTDLYPHQIDAVNKLIKLKIGALYMEMGTGKTRVTLELIRHRIDAGKIDNAVWLCPISVVRDMQRQFCEHADGWQERISVFGIESLSSSVKLFFKLYGIVSTGRTMIVIDESNLVKNSNAIRTKNITKLAEKCIYRIILNGTPVSRNESDLFAQWFILDWRILGYRSYWSFAANHIEYDEKGRVRRCLNVDYLSKKIEPYTFQIAKDECLSLPPKRVSTRYFYLTDGQASHYEFVSEFYLPPPDMEEWRSDAIYRLFTACQQVASGRRLILNEYKDPISSVSYFKDPADNPRIDFLLDTINEIAEEDKIIIWCKYVHEIQDIEKVLAELYGIDSVSLFYGKLNNKKRQESLQKFKDSSRFLIANKHCGGYGLNLQYCHNMIYYNNDFDWAPRAQSEDRVHRIGQTETVNIYNICADYTIDIAVMQNLSRKTNLVQSFRNEINKIEEKKGYVKNMLKRGRKDHG